MWLHVGLATGKAAASATAAEITVAANPAKAERVLGWKAQLQVEQVIANMIEAVQAELARP